MPTMEVPALALTSSSGAQFQFKIGEGSSNEWPVRLNARSADVLQHWYWGPMVHDFAGMSHKERIKLDYCHDENKILGFIDDFVVSEYGLELAGKLVAAREGSLAGEIAGLIPAGVPYEASIEFSHAGLVIEEISEGMTAEVNGVQLEGPLLIFRKWKLTGVAICPNGYDSNTKTEMSRSENAATVKIDLGGDDMPKPTAKLTDTKPANETELNSPETPNATETPETPETETPAGDETELNSPGESHETAVEAVRTELSKFVERFGAETGTEYYLANLSWAEALEKYSRKTEVELAAARKNATELESKLSAVEFGETTPVSNNESNNEKPKSGTGLAAGIRISGREYAAN